MALYKGLRKVAVTSKSNHDNMYTSSDDTRQKAFHNAWPAAKSS